MKHLTSWTQESTPDDTLGLISELAQSHALFGGEQGLAIANLIGSRNFKALCDFELDYSTMSVHEASNCRQALAFFSKATFVDLGKDLRKVAYDKFKQTEVACSDTNHILRQRAQGRFFFPPWVDTVFYRAQQKIARVLGDVPSISDLKLRFGPGATTLTKKRDASTVEKLQAGASCSEDLFPHVARLMEEMPHLSSLWGGPVYSRLSDREECVSIPVSLTDGRLDFVAKNAKTHRAIIVEGSLNTLVQLAIGDYMATRLAAFGQDIRDQERNQVLAREGSVSGAYATLDLSSASDTISTELVYELLPIDWALFLDHSRSSTVTSGGERIKLEKFSSMGNGFTFPLETLIFWALSSAATDDDFASVYGDDIIVSTDSVTKVMEVLRLSGFSLNMEKSYWQGPFRESCGADYMRGIDIRPYYQKDLVCPAELFKLHNYYVRLGDIDRANLVRDKINPDLCLTGPDGFGDGHLVVSHWVKRRHKKHLSHGYGGYIFDTYALGVRRDKRALRSGDYVLSLYSIYMSSCSDNTMPDLDIESASKGQYLDFLRLGSTIASEPIPERSSQVDGSIVKCPSLPGSDGYKKISIYTLSSGV